MIQTDMVAVVRIDISRKNVGSGKTVPNDATPAPPASPAVQSFGSPVEWRRDCRGLSGALRWRRNGHDGVIDERENTIRVVSFIHAATGKAGKRGQHADRVSERKAGQTQMLAAATAQVDMRMQVPGEDVAIRMWFRLV